ncbi:MAG: outer membrane protein assembly factor [Flavobacteriaceae bacterium]|nr:outer membrane protein assembly factor [Flavobacteriaceae bacterium]
MIKQVTKIVLILIVILITSCNAVKRVNDDAYLLDKNTIYINDKKTKKQELYSYLIQRPNQKTLGLPLALYVYNWSNYNFEVSFDDWVKKNPKKSTFFDKHFSNKQTKSIYNFNKNFNNWLKKNGEAPIIINTKKTKKSLKSLKEYFQNNGFFDVEVYYTENKNSKKRATIDYIIKTNKSYFLDTIAVDISSKVIDFLYKKNQSKSFLKKGDPYDLTNFKLEQKRLTNLFRNSGIYKFNKSYIRFDADSSKLDNKVDIKLKISDEIINIGDSLFHKPFKIQKVKNINIYTDYSFNTKDEPYLDSIYYKGYTFWTHKKIKFNPKYFINAIGISPNKIYKNEELKLTRNYLNDLKIFRSPIAIDYSENKDGSLTTDIYLTPLKKYGIDTNIEVTHSNIKPFGVLGKFAFIDRNIFKGSEIFELSFQASFLNLAEDAANPDFNFFGFTAWEIGATTSLKIPRIFFPINTSKLIPKSMRPKTDISISTSFQKNIGLDRQNITGNISYFWKKSSKFKHRFDLINIQYINNLNPESYFDIFNSELNKLKTVAQTIIDPINMDVDGDINNALGYIDFVLNPLNRFETTNSTEFLSTQKVKERRSIITEDILVPTISYTFTYDNKKSLNDNRFSFFRAKLISAGSLINSLIKKNEDGRSELFDLPIAQYIKSEFEYKKYWDLGRSNHLIFRSFVGAAFPFGNSTEIPFSRSYRAGGSNDIRAWQTFDLGPGTSLSNLEFNIGNLKMVSNFEYRFKFINNFYAAIFIDAGNIWDLTNSELTNSDAKFKGVSSLQDIAIGSGFGIRYDFSFLIFRIDLGFKTYEPYLDNNKWFRNYNFKNEVFNFGINYPF